MSTIRILFAGRSCELTIQCGSHPIRSVHWAVLLENSPVRYNKNLCPLEACHERDSFWSAGPLLLAEWSSL